MKTYKRHSAVVRARKQWKAVRHAALKRDGFRCVGILPDGRRCGARGRLEVDHILPVRTHPHLAYVLENCQTLCVSHHSKKTIEEIGLRPADPAREAWRDLVHELTKPSIEKEKPDVAFG